MQTVVVSPMVKGNLVLTELFSFDETNAYGSSKSVRDCLFHPPVVKRIRAPPYYGKAIVRLFSSVQFSFFFHLVSAGIWRRTE